MTVAVVVGGGIAGLLSAAALAVVVDDVVVVERDRSAARPAPRRGVPQSEQLHNLLTLAQRHIDVLLPGVFDTLDEWGCGRADVSADTFVFELGRVMPQRTLGLELWAVERTVLEHVLRRHLLDTYRNVQIVDDATVTGLQFDGRSITGVIGARDGNPMAIGATLTVDATGVGARGETWLGELGLPQPSVESRHVDQWYVSTLFGQPAPGSRHQFWMAFPFGGTRGALVSPVDATRWYVSCSGSSTDPIPRTVDDVRAYLRSVGDPTIAALVAKAPALSAPKTFRRLNASWRHYEDCPPPEGFVAVGDAVASLNPLFGQGASVAAAHAVTLRSCVAGHRDGTVTLATERFVKETAALVSAAWNLGQLLEHSLQVIDDGNDLDVSAALGELVEHDVDFHRIYVEIWHLCQRADVLQHEPFRTRLIDTAKTRIN